jgi:hypothetical protein
MNEQRIHRIFEVSVLLKGAHAFIECIGGLALAFVSTTSIVGWVNRLTQDELIEDPNDFIATHAKYGAEIFCRYKEFLCLLSSKSRHRQVGVGRRAAQKSVVVLSGVFGRPNVINHIPDISFL